jgi:uncharacterized protein
MTAWGMTQTRLSTTIDFDRPGKQTGFLRLPHSVHESAYGWIPIPLVVVKNGDGPTILLSAGNHGDEYEGQVALMRLIREIEPDQVRGRIIFLPAANFPAAMAGRRTSPIDGGNLNRSFPGDPSGTPTRMIAHYIEHVLLPLCDYSIDLHSGGSSLMYVPSSLGSLSPNTPERNAKVLAMMRAFGAPVGYIASTPMGTDQTLSSGAMRQNVISLGTELGGGGAVTPAALAIAEQGLRRVLKLIGIMPDVATLPAPETRLMRVGGPEYFVYTTEAGVFEPLAELGDTVELGQPAAILHFSHTPWRTPETVFFDHAGVVLCKRVPGRTERGDCLFHLGTDAVL